MCHPSCIHQGRRSRETLWIWKGLDLFSNQDCQDMVSDEALATRGSHKPSFLSHLQAIPRRSLWYDTVSGKKFIYSNSERENNFSAHNRHIAPLPTPLLLHTLAHVRAHTHKCTGGANRHKRSLSPTVPCFTEVSGHPWVKACEQLQSLQQPLSLLCLHH